MEITSVSLYVKVGESLRKWWDNYFDYIKSFSTRTRGVFASRKHILLTFKSWKWIKWGKGEGWASFKIRQ